MFYVVTLREELRSFRASTFPFVYFPIALIFVAIVADAPALWLGERWETGQEARRGSTGRRA